MTVIENAYAKINLGLKVIGKRKDGYHDIFSIFQTVDLHDDLIITFSEKPGLECSNPEVPTDSANLVKKAEELFFNKYGNVPILHFKIIKRIPVGAGLAGGSADAAAALRGLRVFYDLDVTNDMLYDFAYELGSDIPFLLRGGTAIVSGRGEIIEHIEWPFDFTYIIVYPKFAISTKWAYENLEKNIGMDNGAFKEMTYKLKESFVSSDEFLNVLENDFNS